MRKGPAIHSERILHHAMANDGKSSATTFTQNHTSEIGKHIQSTGQGIMSNAGGSQNQETMNDHGGANFTAVATHSKDLLEQHKTYYKVVEQQNNALAQPVGVLNSNPHSSLSQNVARGGVRDGT